MANREQHSNREKRKPKKEKETVKTASATPSPFSSVVDKEKVAASSHGRK